ncbi:MAG: hypothetical protein MJA30_05115, partial [Cytophagales bacterium]|nr:hypothetical protein [Cytophagales bacterium]
EGKMGWVAGALFFGFVFFPRRDAYGMDAQKKMKTGLRTSKSREYCSLRGLHYPRHLKNNAFFAKKKRSPVKFNFQGHHLPKGSWGSSPKSPLTTTGVE